MLAKRRLDPMVPEFYTFRVRGLDHAVREHHEQVAGSKIRVAFPEDSVGHQTQDRTTGGELLDRGGAVTRSAVRAAADCDRR